MAVSRPISTGQTIDFAGGRGITNYDLLVTSYELRLRTTQYEIRSTKYALQIKTVAHDDYFRGGIEINLGHSHKAPPFVHLLGYLHHFSRVQGNGIEPDARARRIHSSRRRAPTPLPRDDGGTASKRTSGH